LCHWRLVRQCSRESITGSKLPAPPFEQEWLMSLKAFHLIFITVSMLLAAGFGVWAILDYRATGDASTLAWGVGSWVGLIAMGAYGRWFLQKLHRESYL